MPWKPKKPCAYPGCGALTFGRYCEKHAADNEARRESDAKRGSSAARGYGDAWRKARAAYLRRHPLCSECAKHDRVTEATVVDHIIPHRGDMKLFWDHNNWQSLCADCHNSHKQRFEKSGRVSGCHPNGTPFDLSPINH